MISIMTHSCLYMIDAHCFGSRPQSCGKCLFYCCMYTKKIVVESFDHFFLQYRSLRRKVYVVGIHKDRNV